MKAATALPLDYLRKLVLLFKLRRSLRLLLVTLYLGIAQPFAAIAQTSSSTTLPPAAQEALDKGIIAARVPDYLLAIRYFDEARKLAPQAPVVFLNMGLAESRIPGRELRAMAWFGAYLSAYPDAPNAAAVREQIGTLEIRNQSNVLRLIKTVQDAAGKIIDEDIKRTFSITRAAQIRSERLVHIAKVQIMAGDSAGAKTTLAFALKSAASVQEAESKDSAREQIAFAQVQSGDIAGAQRTTDLLSPLYKSYVLIAIAEARAKADIAPTLIPQRSSTSDTQSPILPVIPVSDWLTKLDDENERNVCPLNSRPFADLVGHLKTQPSGDPWEIFNGMLDAAERIVKAQNVVVGMLKQ